MITIHEKTAQKFDTLGLGALLPRSCVVTEEINGAYELKLSHPYDEGGKWKRIERGRILYAPTPRGRQPFRIYNVKPNMSSIEVNARHIFYDLLDNQCSEISFTGTASGALTALQGAFSFTMPFSFATDISISGALATGRMNPVQALLSDDEETTSFVKGFGGELLRDGFKVSILNAMGQDRDVAIRYGKNLIGLEVTEDEADVKTRILCYGSDGSATVESPYINEYVYPKIHTLEDEEKTAAELKAEAQALFDGGADIPLVNIKVDFIVLADTVEYANYAPLEEVFLGDIVTIINQRMNFAKKARVISYEWDCLLERYNEVELGDFMPTLASSVTSGVRSGSLASAASVTASAVAAALNSHMQDKNNPHEVTAAQTGGSSGGSSDADTVLDLLEEHEDNKENPHGVTAAQAGAYTREEVDELMENVTGGSGATVHYGGSDPTSTIGNDGDLYVQSGNETEYTPLEYIEATGSQCLDTLFVPNQDTRVIADMEYVSNTELTYLFAARDDINDAMFELCVYADNKKWFDGYGTQSATPAFDGMGEYHIDKNKNVTTINETTVTHTANSFQPSQSLHIFALKLKSELGYFSKSRMRTFQIYSNGTLAHNLIPVKDKDGVVCAYDKQKNAYHYNVGTGSFVAGPELAKETTGGSLWLKQNGTWTQVLKGAA